MNPDPNVPGGKPLPTTKNRGFILPKNTQGDQRRQRRRADPGRKYPKLDIRYGDPPTSTKPDVRKSSAPSFGHPAPQRMPQPRSSAPRTPSPPRGRDNSVSHQSGIGKKPQEKKRPTLVLDLTGDSEPVKAKPHLSSSHAPSLTRSSPKPPKTTQPSKTHSSPRRLDSPSRKSPDQATKKRPHDQQQARPKIHLDLTGSDSDSDSGPVKKRPRGMSPVASPSSSPMLSPLLSSPRSVSKPQPFTGQSSSGRSPDPFLGHGAKQSFDPSPSPQPSMHPQPLSLSLAPMLSPSLLQPFGFPSPVPTNVPSSMMLATSTTAIPGRPLYGKGSRVALKDFGAFRTKFLAGKYGTSLERSDSDLNELRLIDGIRGAKQSHDATTEDKFKAGWINEARQYHAALKKYRKMPQEEKAKRQYFPQVELGGGARRPDLLKIKTETSDSGGKQAVATFTEFKTNSHEPGQRKDVFKILQSDKVNATVTSIPRSGMTRSIALGEGGASIKRFKTVFAGQKPAMNEPSETTALVERRNSKAYIAKTSIEVTNVSARHS
ncbi:hypothetical protein FHW69_003493 [Luteibacter sp. Sphag1AF]|uniref:hypothetical protein n=1 Tax=Luteibacter sp. Sphag1AF TaxID=2587031 RepID=UPI001622CD7B|nr:hypothetical protein [Luteibacter sp. Sphag1AF]MBB3228848.1 hypothetical protein [Luteibacter sp. Sphag1AF]